MKTNLILFLCIICISCTDHNTISMEQDGVQLTLETSIGNQTNTRAAIIGKQLPSNSIIGVSVLTEDGDTPYNDYCHNIEWINKKDQWLSERPVLLSERKARLIAYYPYSKGINDLHNIPLSMSGTDYLWACSTEETSLSSPHASLKFEHLLSRIVVKLNNQDLQNIHLSEIKIRSRNNKAILPATNGRLTFNAQTGEINGICLDSKEEISFKIPDSGIEIANNEGGDLTISTISLPVTFDNNDLEFVLVIDGKELPAVISSVNTRNDTGSWQQGYSYEYGLTVSRSTVSVTSSSFIAWVDVPLIYQDITAEQKYVYSNDKKCLFYKNQLNNRFIGSQSEDVFFSIFSNSPEDLSSQLSGIYDNKGMFPASAHIIRERMPENLDSINGERILGEWRYQISINVNPNLYEQDSRSSKIRIMYAGSELAVFSVIQKKSDWVFNEVKIGTRFWMDRNLGANSSLTAGGYFYVGRNLPYPYFNSSATGPYNQQYYIKGDNPVSPWKNNDFNSLKALDAIYANGKNKDNSLDPCPQGWHIPTMSEFITLVNPVTDNESGFGRVSTLSWPFFRRDIINGIETIDLQNETKYIFTGNQETMEMILTVTDTSTNKKITFPVVSYYYPNTGGVGDKYTLNLRTSTISTGTPDSQRFVFFGGGSTGSSRRFGFNATSNSYASQIRCIKDI